MDKVKFRNTIQERLDIVEKIKEHVDYLEYDINPIGGAEHMFEMMEQSTRDQIFEIETFLEAIKTSLFSCRAKKRR